jgi:hypothetical protein
VPSSQPSMVPSMVPSFVPSMVPSFVPSMVPSMVPSFVPSMVPSTVPSFVPSMVPSSQPSMVPSEVPSYRPSMVPSFVPSMLPSFIPSESPSMVPSHRPSTSQEPSSGPTNLPSASPSLKPTVTFLPSQAPSTFGICNSASRFDGWSSVPYSLSPTPTPAANGGTQFSGDDTLFTLDLPFAYPWLCRRSVTSLKISTNIVVYQGDEATAGFNQPFPSAYARIAVGDSDWYADLNGGSSRILYGIDTVSQRVAIRWDSVYRYGTDPGTGPRASFQVELFPEGGIKICYIGSINYSGSFYSGVEDPLFNVMSPIFNPTTTDIFPPVGCYESRYIL